MSGSPATLTATGCTGTVTWYYNGTQVGTGSPFSTTVPTTMPLSNYYATCTVGGIVSSPSNSLAVTAAEVADLAVSFTVNPGGVYILGDTKMYTITIKNLSTTATSLPTTLKVSNLVSGFTINTGGDKAVGALAPGATQSFNVSLTANNKGAIGSLNANLTTGADNNVVNNSRSVAVNVQNP